MSVSKFKVGDQARVREGLIGGRYYGGIYCTSDMADCGGKVFMVSDAHSTAYRLDGYDLRWSDEMLEPVEKTLYNLSVGDLITSHTEVADITVKILASLDGCYLISYAEYHNAAASWYTAAELDRIGYHPVKPDTPEPTIEIDGKKHKKADVEKAIKDLEVVE